MQDVWISIEAYKKVLIKIHNFHLRRKKVFNGLGYETDICYKDVFKCSMSASLKRFLTR